MLLSAGVICTQVSLYLLCLYLGPITGFLTAMRQEVTRANKGWALDTVTLHNKVLKQGKEEITASPSVSPRA